MLPIIVVLLLLATGAGAQPAFNSQVDRLGVRWEYGERLDPLTDRRELALVATWRGSYFGLLCMQGNGVKMSLVIPAWQLMGLHDRVLRARVGRGEAFEVEVFNDSSDGRRSTVRPDQAGRNLALGLVEGQERLALENGFGERVVLPLTSPRPALVTRWRTRCREIAPPLD